jgi:hypothetical protein
LEKPGFYLIFAAKVSWMCSTYGEVPLYIGQTYCQTTGERPFRRHDAAFVDIRAWLEKNSGYELFFKAGIIATSDQPQDEKLFDAVENCLIHQHYRPKYDWLCANKHYTGSYTGKYNLSVINSGDYSPMDQSARGIPTAGMSQD